MAAIDFSRIVKSIVFAVLCCQIPRFSGALIIEMKVFISSTSVVTGGEHKPIHDLHLLIIVGSASIINTP